MFLNTNKIKQCLIILFIIRHVLMFLTDTSVVSGREKFILCSHDFGAFIGWRFIVKHMDMLEKYIMIGSPSSEVWNKLVTETWTQFKMSW